MRRFDGDVGKVNEDKEEQQEEQEEEQEYELKVLLNVKDSNDITFTFDTLKEALEFKKKIVDAINNGNKLVDLEMKTDDGYTTSVIRTDAIYEIDIEPTEDEE